MVMDLKETIDDCVVSTVSLPFGGLGLGNYETMIIKNGNFMDYQDRYETEEEALQGHERLVMDIKKNGIGDYS